MSTKANRMISQCTLRLSRGMSLLDVLLGIVIFVVGMLALASLQGNLTRSTADANARTVSTNIAEELIEQLRTFDDLRATETCPTRLDLIAAENVYQCIVDGTATIPRNNMNFTVAATVDDWYFMPDGETLTQDTDDLPSGVDTTISSFKNVELVINWEGNDFQRNDGTDETSSAGRLGSGSFTVSTIIPAVGQLGSAKIASEPDDDPGPPPTPYAPGARPDIVAIQVDNGDKFKESTKPVPEIVRAGKGDKEQLVETWFDVITYNTSTSDSAIYLRREEFLVVSCECTFRENNAGVSPTGFLPTIWNGESYTTGDDNNDDGVVNMVSKDYGTVANNQQSQYCDTCCRDHHDTNNFNATYETYDTGGAWSTTGSNGNHQHYTRSSSGLQPVKNNGTYVEACRMVRKDGFMRVTQDFRMEALNAFPAGYLDTLDGVEEYSDYVNAAVEDFYPTSDTMALASELDPPINFPADGDGVDPDTGEPLNPADTTELPLLDLYSQQLRSRAIYLDQLGPDALAIYKCVKGDLPTGCYKPEGVTNVMEVLPFYDLQTTWLAWWVSEPAGTPVSVTSDEVEDNNAHSRGLANLEDPSASPDTIHIFNEIQRGNVGLTVTDPITPTQESVEEATAKHTLFLDVNGGDDGNEPPAYGYTWAGMFTSGVNQVDASSATVTPGDSTFCSRSGTSISCITTEASGGSVTISGFKKKQGQNYMPLYVCATGPGFTRDTDYVADGTNNSATIRWAPWPTSTKVTGVTISIESTDCL